MFRIVVICVLVTLSFAAAAPALAQVTDPIRVINSDGPVADKIEACRMLAQQGTADAVPVLAPLLLDEKLSHMARYALEPMPYPEAGDALRDALGKTSGLLQAGIISSLAARGDGQAVPELAKLLSDQDLVVAQAAAKALGDIATPDAAAALEEALGKPAVAIGNSLYDGLLACAGTFSAGENQDRAAAMYDRLLQFPDAPDYVSAAALRGAVLLRAPNGGVPLLVEALRTGDANHVDAALRVARELADNEATAALAHALADLPDDRKVRLLSAFEEGDGAAGPAVLAQAGQGPTGVRVAAIQALTRMGYEPSLGSIEQWASSEDAELANAARESLSYFPGGKGDAAIVAMLGNKKPEARRIAVELIGEGALESPVEPLMAAALRDENEAVRVAALTALQDYAGLEELPPLLAKVLAKSSEEEMQATRAVLAALTERQKRMGPQDDTAPPVVVDAFYDALQAARGDAKPVMIRLLGTTGSPKAFDAVVAAYASENGKIKAEALRTLCEWPTPVALPTLKEFATGAEKSRRLPALRGAVRLLRNAEPSQRAGDYAALMANAANAEEKMVVLSGIGQLEDTEGLNLAFAQFADDSVKNEAVQTAINIARNLGSSATPATDFFNGNDLAGWTGNAAYWSVQDGVIAGHSDSEIPKNEFLWSGVDVGDFYLVLDVRLEPNAGNAGVQFRSKPINGEGQAQGYQADIGKGYWGRLYHEHGRGMLDDTDAAEQAVKVDGWNRYEVLAVGPAIWTAINGTLGTAYLDLAADAERSGRVALQMHSGPPLTAQYRIVKLVHNPKIDLEQVKVEELIGKLRVPEQ